MRPWPNKHRNLLAIMIFVTLAVVAAYIFLVRPRAQEVADVQHSIDDLMKELNDTGWPTDADRLTGLLEDARKRLEGTDSRKGVRALSADLLTSTTGTFSDRIVPIFETPEQFMDNASQLDYQEEFNRLERSLFSREIFITEASFGLSEESSSDYTYQLLLQVWTVDELVKLALGNNLTIAKNLSIAVPTGTARQPKASKLRVMPMKVYVLNSEDELPYLLTFPIRMTVRGTVDEVASFLRSLQDEGRFFPLTRFEMITENPALRGRPDEEGNIAVSLVEATVECSSLFRPFDDAPKQKKSGKKAPRGA